MTPAELQLAAGLLLAEAQKLDKDDPELPRLLLAACKLLERSEIASTKIEAAARLGS